MINPKICPFCKQENRCEVDATKNKCWCINIDIPSEINDYVPKKFKMKACICKKCIELFTNNKAGFIKLYT